MLALIDEHHPLIEPYLQYWAKVVAYAFAGGTYDREAELAREQALTGIPSRRLYPFHVYYPLLILSSTRHRLSPDLERRMLEFLLHKPGGIYYVCEKSLDVFPQIGEKGFMSWLHAQEILSRFEAWKGFAADILNWLWSQRNETGLWNMGKGTYHSAFIPLSESWRRAGSRMVDCSVRVLSLLHRYFE